MEQHTLNVTMEQHSDANDASRIGGNHVLMALVETGLYQRVWPGSAAPSV